ncbi:nucleotide disphospho-sugar-binding domain-containing protein [Streptosporangium subroseum]|uniref:nucleotide disphospho-sugar-binding domain-containing protein n=1 Tax=Streptosporangium subroseum TaxID=106412 RepID=UPI003427A1EF
MVGVPIVSHVLPSLALIRELVARGHRVTYANDPFVADRIESTGAELVPCTSTLPVADNDWPADPIAAASLFLDDAVQALPQLRAAYDDDPADLYFYDIGAYAARALAEAQGRTLLQLSPTFVGWDGWTRPAAADNVLLISLGSAYTRQPAFYRQCIAAFGDLPGWHVVLQIGKYTDPEELGTIPPNVEVRSWVPQRAILEQADAFVTHAGMGGCGEGLLAGVPMIAVPQGAEQFMNADRLVELGVARRVDTADATVETLRAALNDLVTDPERVDRSKQLQAAARAEGGTPRAADLIENMLAAAEGPAL